VIAVAGLAVAAVAVLPLVVELPRIQSLIASSASQALGRPVKFRSASLSLWPLPAVRMHDVEIADDPAFAGPPFVRLDRADLRLRLWPLLRGHLEFATLLLHEPTITLVHGPGGAGGRWNFASLGGPREPSTAPRAPRAAGGGPPASLASRVVVDRGLVVFERRTADGVALRQRFEDVNGSLTPRGGSLTFSGSGRAMPGGLAVRVTDGTLGVGGGRTLADASLRARVQVDGPDVQPLAAAVLGGEPAVGGAISGAFELAGTLGRPRAAGDVEWRAPTLTRTSSACPEPRRRTLALATVKARVSWRDGRLVADTLTGGLDRGTLTTRLAGATSSPLRTELSALALERIPLERVLVDFLCDPYAVTGALDLTGSLALSAADPWRTLAGSGRLRVAAGRVVGARALDLLGGLVRPGDAAPRGSSPLEFESIIGSWEITHGVVTSRDLTYTSRAMTVRAMGDYALASGRVNADVTVEHGRRAFQARVDGTSGSPVIRMTPAVAGHVSPDRSFKDLLEKFR
jgi:uncharacterized protein involved in outer membrane biogenesis